MEPVCSTTFGAFLCSFSFVYRSEGVIFRRMDKSFLTIGTAGHIDHGKSALVEALTGTHPDRYEEEMRRGMTIDLGFAFYKDHIAIIDVPGHEKFVRTMIAGAFGIDLAMMVIAADDGIMPQSREHLDILNMLKIRQGIIVITKTDLADTEWLELLEEDIRGWAEGTFLKNVPIFRTSVISGAGMDILTTYLDQLHLTAQQTMNSFFKYYVDRTFTVTGHGTVTTGTVAGGKVSVGDLVEINPGKIRTQVRSLQIHNHNSEVSYPGTRTAINLQNVKREEIRRGSVISAPNEVQPSRRFLIRFHQNAECPIEHNQRVRLLTGTNEVIGRIRIADSDQDDQLAYAILENDLFVFPGDRLIIRSYSPVRTLCGGDLLFSLPENVRLPIKFLRRQESRFLFSLYVNFFPGFHNEGRLHKQMIYSDEQPETAACWTDNRKQKWYASQEYLFILKEKTQKSIDDFHKQKPWSRGKIFCDLLAECDVPAELTDAFRQFVTQDCGLIFNDERVQLPEFRPHWPEKWQVKKDKLINHLNETGICDQSRSELRKILNMTADDLEFLMDGLAETGDIYWLHSEYYATKAALNQLQLDLINIFSKQSELRLGEIKEALGVSRKLAVPVLEFCDNLEWTVRNDDIRRAGSKLGAF